MKIHMLVIAVSLCIAMPLEAHASTLIGNSANNTLSGGPGPDEIFGDGAAYDGDVGFNEVDPLRPPSRVNPAPAEDQSGNDTLFGRDGNDRLYGQGGLDRLNGGRGADTFVFENSSAWNNTDVIEDYNVADGDMLDISDLLSAYNAKADNLADFVKIEINEKDSIVSIDRDGKGTNYAWTAIAMLENTTMLPDVASLVSKGNLLTSKK